MESKLQSSAAQSSPKEGSRSGLGAIVTDCGDDVRYVLMRFLRLAGMTAGEIGFIAGVSYGTMSMLMGLMSLNLTVAQVQTKLIMSGHHFMPWTLFAVHPFVWCPVLYALGIFSMFCAYSMSAPYRYKTSKPGLNVKECWCCGVSMADDFFCQKCKSFRPSCVVSWMLWFLSGTVTFLFVVHDVVAFVFVIFYGTGGGGK